MKRTAILTSVLLAGWLLAGCSAEEDWWNLEEELVTTDTVSIEGRVYALAPYSDRVVQIDRATREVRSIQVGRNPRVLMTQEDAEGAHRIYTINEDDHSMSIIDVDAFDANPEEYIVDELALRPFFDQLIFSPGGDLVLSFIGNSVAEADLAGHGSVNPNEVAIIDLESLDVTFLTLESRPTDVLFSDLGDKALIATRTGIELLPLDGSPLDTTSYPFTTDPAYPIGPSLMRVHPDGELAFAAAPGSDVVYVLDLIHPSFNLVGTTFTPTDIAVTDDGTITAAVGGTSQLAYFDTLDPETHWLETGTPVDTLVMAEAGGYPMAIAYARNSQQRTFATIEFDDGEPEVETYATDDPITRIEMDPTGQTLVIFHADTGWGSGRLSMFNLTTRLPSTILLESPPHDMTFLASEDSESEPVGYVLVVLKDADKLVRYSLTTYEASVIHVPDRPHAVRSLNDPEDPRLVYVVHDQPLGQVTFFNPYLPLSLPGGYPTVFGYGLTDILD